MELGWHHESPPNWDDTKQRIVGGAPHGALPTMVHAPGDLLPGEWWHVTEAGKVIGYGWMDCTWGDAEILVAVDPQYQGHGVGRFILDQLEREASSRGLNYIYNVVPPAHPAAETLTAWLQRNGFEPSGDDGQLLRRRAR